MWYITGRSDLLASAQILFAAGNTSFDVPLFGAIFFMCVGDCKWSHPVFLQQLWLWFHCVYVWVQKQLEDSCAELNCFVTGTEWH